ncbi:hypothetical protein DMN91_006828 [Ooceraea biroi]|uniref:RING-type domain-containing protein n=1 Tax=Ooceraea biroi TaxID=2015173 RepID=A0A3L8DIN9_OOCBI|nr:putative inhibitor of apoptosis [Ooceraea biroi]RLU20221.1 hypothetical protein DMN91_006828 [Ooceraea biroi]
MTTDCIERYIFPQNLSSPLLGTHFTIDELDEVGTHDYRFESVRLQSYKDWPCPWMKPERLAAAGFYYTGESDKVKCFECSVEICQWQRDDNPMVDHHRWSGKCRFVRNVPCGNVPIGADPTTIPAPSPKGKDVCGPYGMVYMPFSGPDHDLDFEETMKFNLNSIGAVRPKYPEYASYDARLRTFETWPISMRQDKAELASAGFYYTGNSDQTLCYHCGGGLKNWEPNDEPWQQHAAWFKHCPYLLTVKGRDFVNKAIGKTCYKDSLKSFTAGELHEAQMQSGLLARANSETSLASGDTGIESIGSAAEAGSVEGSIESSVESGIESGIKGSIKESPVVKAHTDKQFDKDARMCKICYSRELRMVFIPCGHLLTCAECSKNMKICGVCRKPVKVTLQAYIP